MEENNEKLKQIALWLYDLTREETIVKKNILYENSNNNENWHSRIMRMLLDYHEEKNYPILDSFIDLLNNEMNLSINKVSDYKHPPRIECYNEWENIDVLIKIDNNAIIIENKIYWAVDQDHQIERYIKSVKSDYMIESNNIYVVYLTSDGNKIVSDYSYTDEAKSQLDNNHFIPLNYKKNILPWLKDKVLIEVDPENKILYSSIVLYINFLDNIFKQQDNNQIIYKLIEKMEKNGIEMSSLDNCFNSVIGASKLLESLNNIKEKRIIETAKVHITEPLEKFLKNLDKDLILYKNDFSLGNFDIRIKHKSWKMCHIHLGIWQYKNYGGLAYNEANISLSQKVLDMLKEKFPAWKGDNNEPKWIYFDRPYRDYFILETWKLIENGKFEEYIERFIKDILDKVKDVEL